MVVWLVCCQCRVLEVSRSGFYAWLRCVASSRRERRKFLHQQILSIFLKHRKRAGRRQIHRNLTRDGVSVGLNTVGRIMREHAIRPWYCKPFRRPRRDKDRQNVKPNNLNRAFQPGMPNSEGPWLWNSARPSGIPLGPRESPSWVRSLRDWMELARFGRPWWQREVIPETWN
jgi:hypothetical protein